MSLLHFPDFLDSFITVSLDLQREKKSYLFPKSPQSEKIAGCYSVEER